MRYYIEEAELGVQGRVTLHTEPNPSRVEVWIVRGSIEAMREKVLQAAYGPVWANDEEASLEILAAIGITEEQ